MLLRQLVYSATTRIIYTHGVLSPIRRMVFTPRNYHQSEMTVFHNIGEGNQRFHHMFVENPDKLKVSNFIRQRLGV